jgi:hypothetical protein
MNADNERNFRDLIDARKFNGNTLVSGEHWQKPTVSEIQLVRDSFPLLTASWPTGWMWTNAPSANGNPARPDGVHHLVLSVLAGRTGDAAR